MSSSEEIQRLLDEYRERAEKAERLAVNEQQARADEQQARAEELAMRQAPTRLLDYIRHVDQNVFAAFTVEPRSSSTSQGTTSVEGRFYPQHFQPWAEFASAHEATFKKLVDTFDGDGGAYFPSILAIETTGGDVSPAAADEQDLRPFIRASIEKPAARIVSKYLELTGHPTVESIRFRNNAYGLSIGVSDDPMQWSPEQQQMQEAEEQRGRPRKRHSPVRTIGVPDRWAFGLRRGASTTTHILVAEYKAAHRLPPTKLREVLSRPPTDDFFPRATRKDGLSPFEVKGSVLVARVLCQAYHYMITSGLEFGYVASGSGLILLRVPEDDPDTLYYVWKVFQPAFRNVAQVDTSSNKPPSTPRPFLVPRAPKDTAIAYLASLSMMALDSAPRPSEWIGQATDRLQRWPGPKKAVTPLSDTLVPMPPGGGGDDDGSGDGGGGTDNNNGGGSSRDQDTRNTTAQSSRKRACDSEPANDSQAATKTTALSTLASTPPRRRFIVEPPTLPHCTQACLRGLARGLPLDPKCPNVKIHMMGETSDRPRGSHALTASEVCERVVAQLAKNMDKDCECLDKYGCFGRRGVLFKITVTGYGYTLVAKGVQYRHRHVLEHEAALYRCLASFQGRLVPVCLGVVELERDIPLHSCAVVSHLMLMSYAGPDLGLHSSDARGKKLLPRDVDWSVETERTWDELEAAGLQDEDLRSRNVAWCAEVGRVMQFDFDQATFVAPNPAVKRDLDAYQQDEAQEDDSKDMSAKKRPRADT
ncbi:MAG: hypothetical protein STHCBS139747_004169 [Sporothrix thermara]